jgi:hypothetical protein
VPPATCSLVWCARSARRNHEKCVCPLPIRAAALVSILVCDVSMSLCGTSSHAGAAARVVIRATHSRSRCFMKCVIYLKWRFLQNFGQYKSV